MTGQCIYWWNGQQVKGNGWNEEKIYIQTDTNKKVTLTFPKLVAKCI